MRSPEPESGLSVRADGGESTLSLEPGEQALVVTDRTESVLDSLPAEAFQNLLVVSTAAHPSRLERRVRTSGHDPNRVGVVPVTGTSIDYDGPMWVSERASPGDLTGISIRVTEAMKHVQSRTGWVCFDSVSTLYMYADEARVRRFLDSLVGTIREREVHGVYAVASGVLSEDQLEALQSLVDVEIDSE